VCLAIDAPLQIYEEANGSKFSSVDSEGLIHCYLELGQVAARRGDLHSSLENYERAIAASDAAQVSFAGKQEGGGAAEGGAKKVSGASAAQRLTLSALRVNAVRSAAQVCERSQAVPKAVEYYEEYIGLMEESAMEALAGGGTGLLAYGAHVDQHQQWTNAAGQRKDQGLSSTKSKIFKLLLRVLSYERRAWLKQASAAYAVASGPKNATGLAPGQQTPAMEAVRAVDSALQKNSPSEYLESLFERLLAGPSTGGAQPSAALMLQLGNVAHRAEATE
jgi:tetratricopeptide (TPR) repeat protein